MSFRQRQVVKTLYKITFTKVINILTDMNKMSNEQGKRIINKNPIFWLPVTVA